MSEYDQMFYIYQREGALRSARIILPLLHEALDIKSVLDVGCGAGAWLKAHEELGVVDVVGMDGDYVDRELLLIDALSFRPYDITQDFDLGRTFDLVQCLEVAEHLPRDAGPALVDNLVRHSRYIMFSAAVPGQGGKGHTNERPVTYWRDLFADRGYMAFDYIRPQVFKDDRIDFWYRFNPMLYVHRDSVEDLPSSVRDTEVGQAGRIRDFSPPLMQARKAALRLLPVAAVSQLAAIKHRRFVHSLQRART